LAPADERTKIEIHFGAAGLKLAESICNRLDHAIIRRLLHQKSRTCGASLSGILDYGC
jgi:hypothetical protein